MNHNNSELQALMDKYQQELIQLQQRAIPTVTLPENTDSAPTVSSDSAATASLQVRVTAAHQAIPVAQALVTIRQDESTPPLHVLLTDVSGLTAPVLLPATDPAMTQEPTAALDLITYNVSVKAPGYFSVRNSGVPLFGDIATVQPVTMIPLPEFEEPNKTELSFSVPKNNL